MSVYALLEEMRGKLDQAQSLINEETPLWLQAAMGEVAAGVHEIRGRRHEAQILAYLATCKNIGDWGKSRDETPWCSAFVNWCMARSGIEGTNSAAARSWAGWGQELDPASRVRGAVVVLSRTGGNHVALDTGRTGASGAWLLCGGNQKDSASISPYSEARVHGYRWPSCVPIP